MLVLFQQTDLTKEPRLKHIINMGEKYLHSERKNMAYIWWISSLKKSKNHIKVKRKILKGSIQTNYKKHWRDTYSVILSKAG